MKRYKCIASRNRTYVRMDGHLPFRVQVSPNLVTSLQNTIRSSLVLTGRELDPDVYMVSGDQALYLLSSIFCSLFSVLYLCNKRRSLRLAVTTPGESLKEISKRQGSFIPLCSLDTRKNARNFSDSIETPGYIPFASTTLNPL